MNDDRIQKLVDETFPEPDAQAPVSEMWRNIQPRLPESKGRPRDRSRFWWLLPAGVTGAAAMAVAVVILNPGSRTVDPETAGEFAGYAPLEQLRRQAPGIYEQNQPAIEALTLAIRETRMDLQLQPDDAYLQSRLDYYTGWQAELVSGLLQWHEENSDVTG